MKLFFFGLCAAAVLLVTSTISFAQEEAIAVAKPADAGSEVVEKTTASDAIKSESKPETPPTKVRPLTVSVQLLRTDLIITGALTDSTLLALKTAFGEASIPLSEVAGVRFPSGQDTSTTLVMLNGDSITGASDVKTITVDTEWGTAKINGENISSMMFVPGLEWQSVNGLNGARWTLTEAKAQPTRPANPSNVSIAPPRNSGSNPLPVPGLPTNPNDNVPRVVFPR